MLPQLAAGGGGPRPRKLSPEDVRRAAPRAMAMPTARPVSTLGKMRARTMRVGGVPIDVDASTKGSSLIARVWPRMKRAKPGAKTRAKAQGDVVHPAAEYRHDGQGEDERREGQAGVGPAHEQVVDAAAAEARHQPDHQRQDEGDAHRLEGDLHGDARAVDQPGEDVATEVVGAEPVAGADAGVRVGQVLGVRVVGRDPRREDRRNRHEHQPPKAEQDADAGDELQQAPVIGPRPAQRLGVVAGELGLGETHETLTLGFRYP